MELFVEIKQELPATKFVGYQNCVHTTKILAIIVDGVAVSSLSDSKDAIIILQETPFYAEAGGQTGDSGILELKDNNNYASFKVETTKITADKVFLHHGKLQIGSIKVGDEITASVDKEIRTQITRNHSASHLLDAALEKVLGTAPKQQGCLVKANIAHYDFAYPQALTKKQIKQIETFVNRNIQNNLEVTTEILTPQEAVSEKLMESLDAKDSAAIRKVNIDNISIEACCGTHVTRTGDIGLFRVVSESSISSGVRRIVTVTGDAAFALYATEEQKLLDNNAELTNKIKRIEKENKELKAKLASFASLELVSQTQKVADANVIVAQLTDVENKALRSIANELKVKVDNSIIVLGNIEDSKVGVIVAVDPQLTSKIKAGELVNMVAAQVGGKGGGKPDMAQAGGNNPDNLPDALASVIPWLSDKF